MPASTSKATWASCWPTSLLSNSAATAASDAANTLDWAVNVSATANSEERVIVPLAAPLRPIDCQAGSQPSCHRQSTLKSKYATDGTVNTGVLAPTSDGCTPVMETEANGLAAAARSLNRPSQPVPTVPVKSATCR